MNKRSACGMQYFNDTLVIDIGSISVETYHWILDNFNNALKKSNNKVIKELLNSNNSENILLAIEILKLNYE